MSTWWQTSPSLPLPPTPPPPVHVGSTRLKLSTDSPTRVLTELEESSSKSGTTHMRSMDCFFVTGLKHLGQKWENIPIQRRCKRDNASYYTSWVFYALTKAENHKNANDKFDSKSWTDILSPRRETLTNALRANISAAKKGSRESRSRVVAYFQNGWHSQPIII